MMVLRNFLYKCMFFLLFSDNFKGRKKIVKSFEEL